jgi:hypothetical protein
MFFDVLYASILGHGGMCCIRVFFLFFHVVTICVYHVQGIVSVIFFGFCVYVGCLWCNAKMYMQLSPH